MDALAFDLAEIGEGDGIVRSFGITRREIFTEEVKQRLSVEIIFCVSPEHKPLLDVALKRLGIESLIYNLSLKSIGILNREQKVIIVEPYNIEGVGKSTKRFKIPLERDLHDLTQISKVRFRFWEYRARDFVYQPVLEQRFPRRK